MSTGEVARGGRERRSTEEVAREVRGRSREKKLWKEAGKEVVTGGLKGGPKRRREREALDNKVARGGREKRSNRSHETRSAREVAKGERTS